MDILGVRGMKMKTQKELKRSRRNEAVKVVYISSPMKVKTSASEFRALVQELTGRDSDAERFFMEMEINAVGNRVVADDLDHDHRIQKRTEQMDGRDESSDGSEFSMMNNSAAFCDFIPVDQFGINGSFFFN